MEIVVGVDGSPVAVPVLQAAVAEARLRRAKLHVVHVVYVPATWADGMTFMPGNIIDSAYEAAEAVKKSVWERVAAALEGTDVEWVKVDLSGYPPDEVVDYAMSTEADLIVIGSRGFGDLKSLLLGSTSHRVSPSGPMRCAHHQDQKRGDVMNIWPIGSGQPGSGAGDPHWESRTPRQNDPMFEKGTEQ